MDPPSVPISAYGNGEPSEDSVISTLEGTKSKLMESSALKPDQLQRIDAAFCKGGDVSKTIDIDTMTKLLVNLRAQVSQEQIDQLLEGFDAGLQGRIEHSQVLEAAEAIFRHELEKEQLKKAFSLLDRDGNGFISLEHLTDSLQQGENGLTSDEVESFLNQSGCKVETCFDFRKFVDQVAFAPVVLRVPPKKRKGKGKKR